MIADSLSSGVLIGVPLVVVLLLISLGLLVAGFSMRGDSYSDAPIAYALGGGLLLLTLVGAAWGFYPYHGEYHRWHITSGKVAEINSRFLSGDKGGTSQKFVVRFANGDERGCLDTRCSLVKVGDSLTLTCKRKWQFTGQDGWDCNYVGDEVSR